MKDKLAPWLWPFGFAWITFVLYMVNESWTDETSIALFVVVNAPIVGAYFLMVRDALNFVRRKLD